MSSWAARVPTCRSPWADRQAFERDLLATLLGGAPFRIARDRLAAVVTCDARACAYRGARRGPAGEGAFDTVNRGGRTFGWVLGRLTEGRSIADLRRWIARCGGAFVPPPWFLRESGGETPARSRMTWLVDLAPGDKALVATSGERTRVLAAVAVLAAR